MKVVGIIPARYQSSRFPGKPLVKILGKSMIQRVYEQCVKSKKLSDIIIATDDKRIEEHVLKFGGKVVVTSKTHKTGTDRCNEVAQNLTEEIDVIVNIQGDEPFINPMQIDEIIALFKNPKIQIGTLAKKINCLSVLEDTNTPKAIFEKKGRALNFCRKITAPSKTETYYKHIGIYAYKKETLAKICKLPQSKNEIENRLEQLRWLDNNYPIQIGITQFSTLSVDTPEDIKKIEQKMR
tara:strand:- start:126 stop:839 length:714 start_codon:yes stop_codon:yes gene_type:complete